MSAWRCESPTAPCRHASVRRRQMQMLIWKSRALSGKSPFRRRCRVYLRHEQHLATAGDQAQRFPIGAPPQRRDSAVQIADLLDGTAAAVHHQQPAGGVRDAQRARLGDMGKARDAGVACRHMIARSGADNRFMSRRPTAFETHSASASGTWAMPEMASPAGAKQLRLEQRQSRFQRFQVSAVQSSRAQRRCDCNVITPAQCPTGAYLPPHRTARPPQGPVTSPPASKMLSIEYATRASYSSQSPRLYLDLDQCGKCAESRPLTALRDAPAMHLPARVPPRLTQCICTCRLSQSPRHSATHHAAGLRPAGLRHLTPPNCACRRVTSCDCRAV